MDTVIRDVGCRNVSTSEAQGFGDASILSVLSQALAESSIHRSDPPTSPVTSRLVIDQPPHQVARLEFANVTRLSPATVFQTRIQVSQGGAPRATHGLPSHTSPRPAAGSAPEPAARPADFAPFPGGQSPEASDRQTDSADVKHRRSPSAHGVKDQLPQALRAVVPSAKGTRNPLPSAEHSDPVPAFGASTS